MKTKFSCAIMPIKTFVLLHMYKSTTKMKNEVKKEHRCPKIFSCPPECKIFPACHSTITKKIKSSREDEKSFGTQPEACTMIHKSE